MNRQRLIVKILIGFLMVGAIGFGVTTLIPYLAPKEKIVSELNQVKKMLRQGFDIQLEDADLGACAGRCCFVYGC